MFRIFTAGVALAILLLPGVAVAQCTTIKDGGLETLNGDPITIGYDDFGYNYEAQIFNGRYCDEDRVEAGDYCDWDLMMKWSDSWLSNKDCDGDNLLDRHNGILFGSGQWLTNHQSGKVEVNGRLRTWTYFVKIVAPPADAYTGELEGVPYWFTADGTIIGEVIWDYFAVVQRVLNDPSEGAHGILYLSPVGPGFGHIQ